MRQSARVSGLDISDLVIALTAATVAPLLVDLLPVPKLAGAMESGRLCAAVSRMQRTSAQISVRLAFLLLAGFVC